MKRQRFISGTVVRIPTNEGYHTYGQLLVDPYIQVFDCKTHEELQDLLTIVRKPVLFTVCFFYRQAITNGLWEAVGKLPFDKSKILIPKQYRQHVFNRTKCTLVDIFGNETPASIEECRGLERLAVWLPKNIVTRIEDHYAKRQNSTVHSLRLKEEGE